MLYYLQTILHVFKDFLIIVFDSLSIFQNLILVIIFWPTLSNLYVPMQVSSFSDELENKKFHSTQYFGRMLLKMIADTLLLWRALDAPTNTDWLVSVGSYYNYTLFV